MNHNHSQMSMPHSLVSNYNNNSNLDNIHLHNLMQMWLMNILQHYLSHKGNNFYHHQVHKDSSIEYIQCLSYIKGNNQNMIDTKYQTQLSQNSTDLHMLCIECLMSMHYNYVGRGEKKG